MSEFRFLPVSASTLSGQVDALYLFLVGLTVFFTLLISGLFFYFALKYRRRGASVDTPHIHGSTALEITWTVIPLIIVMGIFVWSTVLYLRLSRPPSNAMEVWVTAKQWMWKIQHPEGRREINELHVPLGTAVKLTMTSEDVIHSFFVPVFRTKADVLPNRYTTVWFNATKPGKYHLFCAEYCGTKHSGMIGWVYVMEPGAFQAWLAGGSEEGGTLAERGQKLFQELACSNCHELSGDKEGRCPNLRNLFGTQVELTGGKKVAADEAYLRESILNPNAKVVSGFQPNMPTFQGLVNEEGIVQLVEFIKSIGPKKEKAKGAPAAVPTPEGKK